MDVLPVALLVFALIASICAGMLAWLCYGDGNRVLALIGSLAAAGLLGASALILFLLLQTPPGI